MNESKNRNTILAFYAIVPAVLLVAFSVLYKSHHDESVAAAAISAKAAAIEAEEKAAKQAEMEASLKARSKAVAQAKADARAKKEDAIRKEKAAKLADVTSRLRSTRKSIESMQDNLAELERKLASERQTRTNVEHSHVALSIEISKLVAKRDAADLEAQRLTTILSRVVDREIDLAKQKRSEPM